MASGPGVTGYTYFTPGVPKGLLPADFKWCMDNPSAACDVVVGGLTDATGYCSTPAFAQTTYCACVNNALPCPARTSAQCLNAGAYLPWAMTAGPAADRCRSVPICISTAVVNGDHDILSNLVQECGPVAGPGPAPGAGPGAVAPSLSTTPAWLLVLVFVMLVLIVELLVLSEGGAGAEATSGGGACLYPGFGRPDGDKGVRS